MRDTGGKWHILECKGTQTPHHHEKSLKTGLQQKYAMHLVGSVRGERLTASLLIANEQDTFQTHLKIIDPDDESPLLVLTDNQAGEMDAKANRVALARALGVIGLNELAIEIALPPDIEASSELLLPSEALRVRSARGARFRQAAERSREDRLVPIFNRGDRYLGREIRFDLPPSGGRIPFESVVVRQGVNEAVVTELINSKISLREVDERIAPRNLTDRVTTEANAQHSVISYGELLFSEMIWA